MAELSRTLDNAEADVITNLQSLMTDTKDPTGVGDPSAYTVTYDDTNRTITISGPANFIYYWRGTKVSVATPWVSAAHTNANGSYFLSSTDGTNFTWSTTPWSFKDTIQIAQVNQRTGEKIAIIELHGTMDSNTHTVLHNTIGTIRISGGGITAGTYAENSATLADTTPGFDAAVILDEDLSITIPAWTQGTYTTHRVGASSTSVYDTAAVVPFRNGSGTYIYINDPTTGAEVEALADRYINVYQVLVPACAGTNSQKFRMIMVQPQRQHLSLADAQAESFYGLKLGELNTAFAEYVPYTRITYVTNAGYSNTGKCAIATGGITTLKGTRNSIELGDYYKRNADINIDSPYIIDFGYSSNREEIVLNQTIGSDPYFSSVQLLVHFNGVNNSTNFPDSSSFENVIFRFGNPVISTGVLNFGTPTGLWTAGSGEFLRTLAIPTFAITGDYTVEGWFRRTSSAVMDLFTWGPSPYWNVWKNASNQIISFINGVDRITATAGAFPINTWVHIAVTRASNVNRLFVDGALIGTYTEATSIPADQFWIGGYPISSNTFLGNIDEVRFTNGVARYTAAFTRPTAEFPNGNQYFAIGTQNNTQYFRSSSGFSWYKGGVWSGSENDPGAGGTLLMHINATGRVTYPYFLRIGSTQGLDTADTPFEATGVSTAWLQISIQNQSTGTGASSDFVATNDLGDDTNYFCDIGINSSTYADPTFTSGGPNDSYFLAKGGSIQIVTADNQPIGFFTNGTMAANERMMIYGNGDVGVGGTAELATNATAGFFWIPTMAGRPTGTVTVRTGKKPLVLDTTNNTIHFNSNLIWRSLDDQIQPPNAGGYVTANFYDQSRGTAAASTLAAAANRLDVMPFTVWKDLTIDQIGIAVSTGAAGNANIVIYESNPTTGWPTNRIYVSGNLSTAAIAYVPATYSYTFRRGVNYWIGVHFSAAPTIRSIPLANLHNLGIASSTGTTYFTVLRQSVAFGSSPNPWVFASAQLVSSDGYSIRMRSA
jgi:hypothetical protein